MITLLFVGTAAAGTDRSRFGVAVRAITHYVRAAAYGAVFRIVHEWAVCVDDLQSCLLRHQPDIVHFMVNGNERGDLLIENEHGDAVALQAAALSGLFRILRKRIRCVVLNAAFSPDDAFAIAASVDCVIGMEGATEDPASVAFASAFYQALAFGSSVKDAVELGCNDIHLKGLQHAHIPTLHTRPGIRPEDVALVNATHDAPPPQSCGPKGQVRAPSLRPLPPPPGAMTLFVGRTREREEVDRVLLSADEAAHTAGPRVALVGVGGIGKTALAMDVAKRYSSGRGGGVLWGNLGTDHEPGERATSMSASGVVRASLLRWTVELGGEVTSEATESELFGRVRALITARSQHLGRMLLVLDNVDMDEAAAPVLDAFPECAILVTTRRTNLSILAEMHAIRLGGLERAASAAYVVTVTGRAELDPAHLNRLLDALEDHPLAISLVSRALRAEPELELGEAARLLRVDTQSSGVDPLFGTESPLARCFNLSVRSLPHPALRSFLVAAASQSPTSFSIEAAAYVSGVLNVHRARTMASALAAHGLLDALTGGRYRMHRLIRDHIRDHHCRDGIGFIPRTWEIPALAPLFARFAPGVSAGFANYDWRHQNYFTLVCEAAARDEALVHREWDGIATALFRESGRGLSQAARAMLVRLGAALGGVDLSCTRIDSLMLDGARLDDACLDRCDMSSEEPRRWPSAAELLAAARKGARDLLLGCAPIIAFLIVHRVFGKPTSIASSILLVLIQVSLLLVASEHVTRAALAGGLFFDDWSRIRRASAERAVGLGLYALLSVPASIALSSGVFRGVGDPIHVCFYTLMLGLIITAAALLPPACNGRTCRLERFGVGGFARRGLWGGIFGAAYVVCACILGKFYGEKPHPTYLVVIFAITCLYAMVYPYCTGRDPVIGFPLYSIRAVYLRGASLRRASLRCASLRSARLHRADLTNADLSGADLTGARLAGACLRDADLSGAVVERCDLRGADLSGARLLGVDLTTADLQGATLDHVVTSATTRWPSNHTPVVPTSGHADNGSFSGGSDNRECISVAQP